MKPVVFDGWIYVLIAFFGAAAATFATDDAAKYVDPPLLWAARNLCTAVSASLLALKMFRSTAYADFKATSKPVSDPTITPTETKPEPSKV